MSKEEVFATFWQWFSLRGIKIFLILVGVFLINRAINIIVYRAIKKHLRELDGKKRKRIETLMSVFRGTSVFVIYLLGFLMILTELGVNISPLLAGVGVAGLAVSMAARDIIADFIAGFFIILEDQYHVGDQVKIAGVEGRVKEITLRRTVIEDDEGVVYLIPNNQIKMVTKRKASK